MKKLSLFILLFIFLSPPSFARQIICSNTNLFGEPYLMDFKNRTNAALEFQFDEWLLDGRQPLYKTTFESESVIVLQLFSETAGFLDTIHIDKKSNKLTHTGITGIRDVTVSYGQCKIIN